MPAGDGQRTWFPEMVESLRIRWRTGLPLDDLILLRDQLDEMLRRMRTEKHLCTPVIRCAKCGHVGEAAEPHVSVRALILSLGRFGIASAEEVKALEKSWSLYRKQKGLDLHGKADQPARAAGGGCAHTP
jgi:hypothetical protein